MKANIDKLITAMVELEKVQAKMDSGKYGENRLQMLRQEEAELQKLISSYAAKDKADAANSDAYKKALKARLEAHADMLDKIAAKEKAASQKQGQDAVKELISLYTQLEKINQRMANANTGSAERAELEAQA